MTKMIKDCSDVALQYGMIDGAHHKQWVIDQMLRVVLKDCYEITIKNFNEQYPLGEYEPWDEGIAP